MFSVICMYLFYFSVKRNIHYSSLNCLHFLVVSYICL
uniref:Uncharacterized protein n=1 Tax=Anguilla anguilla TaxID=7936 RepID=A0A0E9Q288_ANGAN